MPLKDNYFAKQTTKLVFGFIYCFLLQFTSYHKTSNIIRHRI